MRKFLIFMVIGVVVGCGKGRRGAVQDAADGPQPGHPELVCPDGTEPAGYAPPVGLEVWCRRYTLQGSWVRHGPAIEWWQLYARKAAGSYFEAKKQGNWTYWYLGGELERSETWNLGQLDGAIIEYYPNGQKKAEGVMRAGVQDGPWTYWYADGKKEREGAFVAGEYDGPWIIYDADGLPKTQRTFRNGRLRFQEEL